LIPSTPAGVADPLGVVVDMVAVLEPQLDRSLITEVVSAVAGGRAKRRRIAHALAARPGILTDGRSPAPETIGRLLTALRDAGAVNVSAPVCAECGKAMRAFQRRGQDWYCGVHGPASAACSVCGNVRPIAQRDRLGQPRCWQCPFGDEHDPTQILIDFLADIDPALDVHTVTAAIAAAAPQLGQRRRLAWALQDRPALLTGAGAHAPVPAVLRLIDGLADHGSGRIIRPPCPHCGRVIALVKPRDGVRLCRNCLAKSRAETCHGCGAHREPATRDENGRALCPRCLISDPANLETCLGCRRRRPVSVRTATGPLCGSCRPVAVMTCSICGRSAPGAISKLTGRPCCDACAQRRARCTSCGTVRRVRSGSVTEPVCGSCTRPDAAWHACGGCGEQTQYRAWRCARCSLRRRLDEVLADASGQTHPQLTILHDHLARQDRPETVLTWLNKHDTSKTLAELAAGQRPLTHAGLDDLADDKPTQHLRAVLAATGVLPTRDEHLIRLERWIADALASHADPEHRALLHRYGRWHVVHRLRRRNNGRHATHGQRVSAQRNIRGAITLLDWLAARGLDLTDAGQADLEQWLNSPTGTPLDAGNFVRWARRNKLTSVTVDAVKWDGPRRVIDSDARWTHARRLLHDNRTKAEDRVAGLLVLLYAQSTTAISRLTLEHVRDDDHEVKLRLGREPIVLPDPLDTLVRELVATRSGHATLGDTGASRWLFPGGQPDRPISATRLGERLHQLGLHPGQDRSTALFGLAAELPAALLARLLGINISVAVAWQRASSGDWTNYAADFSRRTTRDNDTTPPGDDRR
jgi:hypothetical protein